MTANGPPKQNKKMEWYKSKRVIALIIAGIVMFTVAWFLLDHRSEEMPFKACQRDYCIEGNRMSKVEDCIVTERQERICGNYVLFIDEKVKVKVDQ